MCLVENLNRHNHWQIIVCRNGAVSSGFMFYDYISMLHVRASCMSICSYFNVYSFLVCLFSHLQANESAKKSAKREAEAKKLYWLLVVIANVQTPRLSAPHSAISYGCMG